MSKPRCHNGTPEDGPVDPGTTLRHFFETIFVPNYLTLCKGKYRRSYGTAADTYISYCQEDVTIGAITEKTLLSFSRWITGTGRGTEDTAETYVKRLRRILRFANDGAFAIRSGHLETAPFKDIVEGSLMHFFRTVYSVERAFRLETARQYEMSLSMFDRWHGKPVMLEELSRDLVNHFLLDHGEGRAKKTVKRRRADILAIWRYAAQVGELERGPQRIRPIKVPRHVPDAWTLHELGLLLAAAGGKRFDRYYDSGIHRGRFWEAFILTTYDTGLRRGDMLRLARHQINDKGQVTLVQGKTEMGHYCAVRPTTLAAINRTFPPKRDLIFEWPYSPVTFNVEWRRILSVAGQPKRRGNGPQKLRRTSASHLERICPGAASHHLGHLTPDLAMKHYLDPTVAFADRPLPPPLDGGAA